MPDSNTAAVAPDAAPRSRPDRSLTARPPDPPLADLLGSPYEAFSQALAAATAAGLLHTAAGPDRGWQRLTCPGCADRLDLPPTDDPTFPRYAVRAARRVTVFMYRHRTGGQHP
jgi:hypothetical protein